MDELAASTGAKEDDFSQVIVHATHLLYRGTMWVRDVSLFVYFGRGLFRTNVPGLCPA